METKMDSKEIIKELDPDYETCAACKRKIHKSKLRDFDKGRSVCRNSKECSEYFSKPNEC